MIYDYVVLGSRRFLKEANEIGRQVMEKGFSVKLISDPAACMQFQRVCWSKH